jgi:membrane protein implicated in regulation of membrane protease activity
MDLWIVWLITIITLSFVEAATVNLVSIWFIASALISLILSFFDISFFIQFAVFVVIGVLLMITTKPILTKWIKPKDIKTNFDRVIGMTGVVTEEINKNTIGEIKVDGKKWSAISTKKIPVGEEVTVESIDGVKLKVKLLEKRESE